MKRYTAIIEVHDAVLDPHPVNPGYWELLQSTDIPVYMKHLDDRVKSGRQYPLEQIRNTMLSGITLNGEPVEKFNSTVDYAVALALYHGYTHISFYGIDMRTESEYAFEKPGWAFWLGVALGKDVKLDLHSHTDLFQNIYGPKHRMYFDKGFPHIKFGREAESRSCG
jgi:hypothetical protein